MGHASCSFRKICELLALPATVRCRGSSDRHLPCYFSKQHRNNEWMEQIHSVPSQCGEAITYKNYITLEITQWISLGKSLEAEYLGQCPSNEGIRFRSTSCTTQRAAGHAHVPQSSMASYSKLVCNSRDSKYSPPAREKKQSPLARQQCALLWCQIKMPFTSVQAEKWLKRVEDQSSD